MKWLYHSTTIILLISSQTVWAEEKKIVFGGFIDTQYAFDFNAPDSGDRVFTTQPARHNEFNLNLGTVDVKYNSAKIRSRLALQAGTSVQANYSSEPTNGSISGSNLSRHIQEARIGYQLSEQTWIDGGIFFSPYGAEGWISKDNLVLTRSLVADYSPYYLSGLKINHTVSDHLQGYFLVSNGWQNISENNQDKSIGAGIEWSLENVSLHYNTLLGNETSPPLLGTPQASRFRHFHDFIIKSRNLQNWEWVTQYDFGFQETQSKIGTSFWQGALLMTRYKLNATKKLSARVEYYQDKDQVILTTNRPTSFDGFGGSIGYDQILEENVLWRLEARYLKSDANVFPKNLMEWTNSNLTLTTSLAIAFY